ncbi:hypothetical protein NDU88_007339 [Pleurodeles waltl]|uniref:Uncharacterized protein n=1 Tax=Pleurodeles waltl TaxID=8319 RepID=A0AAV7UQD0_PLEWA|nr:hypothetical protein NDU88_007339 [Pleurodeles waltl]
MSHSLRSQKLKRLPQEKLGSWFLKMPTLRAGNMNLKLDRMTLPAGGCGGSTSKPKQQEMAVRTRLKPAELRPHGKVGEAPSFMVDKRGARPSITGMLKVAAAVMELLASQDKQAKHYGITKNGRTS